MGIFSKIRRHAAVASGDFHTIFKSVSIPPLPAAISELLTEINRDDPDIDRLVNLITAEPEISANVLRTVNSPLFALKREVLSIRHAIVMLGLERIRSLILAYSMASSLPEPSSDLFDHEAYWADSLLRSLLATTLCRGPRADQQEAAFAAALLADVALPVLLSQWQSYYEPVMTRWSTGTNRLCNLEQEDFGWDHAQAGAWILQHWDFPAELVCLVGTHNLDCQKLSELDLADTAALAVATAALLPSVLRPDMQRCQDLADTVIATLGWSAEEWPEMVTDLQQQFQTICQQFRLPPSRASVVLDMLAQITPAPPCAVTPGGKP